MNQFVVFSVTLVAFFNLQSVPVTAQSEPHILYDQVKVLSTRKFSKSNAIEVKRFLPVVQENGNNELTFDLLDWLGDYYTITGDYKRAMLLFREAADAAKRSGDPQRISNSEINIGNIYYRAGDYAQSTRTFKPLRDSFYAQGDSLNAGKIEASIALNYLSSDKQDTALQLLLLARTTIRKHGSQDDWLKINKDINALYSQMGMPERSLPHHKQWLAIIVERQDTFDFASAYGNLAYTYQLLGNFKLALTYYDSSLYYSRLQEQDAITQTTLLDISGGYQMIGDYEKSLRYFQDYHTLKEKVLGKNTLDRIAELKVVHETEQQKFALEASEQKVLLLEREARLRQHRTLFIIIGLCFSLFLGLLIFRQWRRDIRHRAIKEKLIAAELVNERLASSLLNTQLENKQEDLTDFALDIERKNKFSKELAGRLDGLRKTLPASLRPQLNELIRFTNSHDQVNDHLETVQENVDQVNHEFHRKLKDAFPNLTQNDKVLAGLLRLNMTNKEVGIIKGISTSSAKMARYRLRKKLNLKPTDDINTFLREL